MMSNPHVNRFPLLDMLSHLAEQKSRQTGGPESCLGHTGAPWRDLTGSTMVHSQERLAPLCLASRSMVSYRALSQGLGLMGVATCTTSSTPAWTVRCST